MAGGNSRHTSEKVHLLWWGYSPDAFKGLAAALYESERSKWAAEDFRRAQQNLTHYKRGGATPDLTLFRQLVKLGFKNDAEFLKFCTPAEFLDSMPADVQARVARRSDITDYVKPDELKRIRARKQPKALSLHRHTLGKGYHVIHVTSDYAKLDLIQALEDDEFDQKFLYLDRTAAERWHNLTRQASKYSTFRNCKDTLEELTVCGAWKKLKDEIGTMLILGAGAAAKDGVLIRSLATAGEAKTSQATQYVVVDTSVHMILSTLRELDELIGHQPPDELEIVGIVADFMSLERVTRLLEREGADIHRDGKRAAFFLPGNTLANFNPEKVFETIYNNSNAGDLFILSLETVRAEGASIFKEHLLARYKDRELVELVLPPIRPFLDKHGIDVIGELAMGKITTQAVNSYWYDLHHFRDEFTIEIRLVEESHRINSLLARSSRFSKDEIVKGVEAMGFKLACDPIIQPVPDLGYDHCQFLLERQAKRRD